MNKKYNKDDNYIIFAIAILMILAWMEYLGPYSDVEGDPLLAFRNDYFPNIGQYSPSILLGLILIPVAALGGLAMGRIHGLIRGLFPSIFSDAFTISIIILIFSYTNINNTLSIYTTLCFFIPFMWGFALRGWVFSTPFFSKILGTKEEQFFGEDTGDKKSKWVFVFILIILYIINHYL